MAIMDIVIPTIIIIIAFIMLYVKVSYVRQFCAWALGKIRSKKEEVAERIQDKGNYELAFRYG